MNGFLGSELHEHLLLSSSNLPNKIFIQGVSAQVESIN